jgi:hypothetical protein
MTVESWLLQKESQRLLRLSSVPFRATDYQPLCLTLHPSDYWVKL